MTALPITVLPQPSKMGLKPFPTRLTPHGDICSSQKNTRTLSASGYEGIKFWVYGADSSNEWKLSIKMTPDGAWGSSKIFTAIDGTWTEITRKSVWGT